MANTASLVIDYRTFDEMDRKDYMDLQEQAVDYLPEAHQALILNLSSHDGVERNHSELIDKITATNAFDIDPDADDEEQEAGFYVVFPEIARMNHECRPNADYRFEHDTMTHYIHALRDIMPGEEISLSYINPIMRRKTRQRRLNSTWGFTCSCHLCTQPRARTDASDARIEQIKALYPEFKNYKADSRATPEMAELLISLYKQENLWGMMYEVYTYAALEYNGVGEPWMATKYARLAVEYGLYSVGENDRDVIEMTKLAEDPWAHWSWLLRTRKRMSWGKKLVPEEDE